MWLTKVMETLRAVLAPPCKDSQAGKLGTAVECRHRGTSHCTECIIPITEKPNALVVKLLIFLLQKPSKDLLVSLIDFLDCGDPLSLAVGTIVAA